jgi:hypothetical protein
MCQTPRLKNASADLYEYALLVRIGDSVECQKKRASVQNSLEREKERERKRKKQELSLSVLFFIHLFLILVLLFANRSLLPAIANFFPLPVHSSLFGERKIYFIGQQAIFSRN